MTDGTRRAAVAERAARAGGVVAREQFRTGVSVETKADKNDPVTAADREAQTQVVHSIRQEFASDVLVCEEDALSSGADGTAAEIQKSVPETGAAWVVDPIDGTANFVRGTRFWATSVAAVVDGDTVGVATYFPVGGDIYAAGPGSATQNGSTVSVSDRTDPETFAVGLTGRWSPSTTAQYGSLFRVAAERFGDIRRLGSMQGVLALVAAGSLDAAFVPGKPHPWDTIAGVHLIRRADGTATDLAGDRWHPESDGLIVSNGTAHSAVLGAVRDGLG
jgi:myo-inositol-1(or 4)-monophosphatase